VSYVPNQSMKPVASLELNSYPIIEAFDASPYRFDSFSQYLAFWTQVIVRNFDVNPLTYRKEPNGTLISLPASSERTVAGWGSFFEVVSATPDGELEYNLVNRKEAFLERKKNN